LAAVRARIFSFLSALARYDAAGAMDALSEGLGDAGIPVPVAAPANASGSASPWTEDRLRKALEEYRSEHGMYRLDPEGRAARHTSVDKGGEEGGGIWRVGQMLQDHDGHNDWSARFEVDLAASRQAGAAAVRLAGFGPAADP